MSGKRVYLASSWRNPLQPGLVRLLREAGHQVYDFRNPPGGKGFSWDQVCLEAYAEAMTPEEYFKGIAHPRSREGFKADFDAMRWADTFVLALPCGRSAHLEAGWAIGNGVQTAILLQPDDDGMVVPELMYLLAHKITADRGELLRWLVEVQS